MAAATVLLPAFAAAPARGPGYVDQSPARLRAPLGGGGTTSRALRAGLPPPRPNGRTFPDTDGFDAVITQWMEENDVPGVSVAVMDGGLLAYEQGYGTANLSTGEPVLPGSMFRLASISKTFCATAVMRLVQEGRLAYNATVFGRGGVLDLPTPAYPGAKRDPRLDSITVYHLLHHTAGVQTDTPMFEAATIAGAMGVASPPSAGDIVRYMVGQPLSSAPGVAYAYANVGYCMLGQIVAAVTGQAYEDYVRTAIFEPLGLPPGEIAFGKTLEGDALPGEVAYYPLEPYAKSVYPPYKPVPTPYGAWDMHAMAANGGIVASPRALVQFLATFPWFNGAANASAPRIISRATLAEMLAPPPQSARQGTWWYGCGMAVRGYPDGTYEAWHDGELNPGTDTSWVHMPHTRTGQNATLIWNILDNTADAQAEDPLMWQAIEAATGWPLLPKTPAPPPTPMPPATPAPPPTPAPGKPQCGFSGCSPCHKWCDGSSQYHCTTTSGVFHCDCTGPSKSCCEGC